MGRLSWIIQQAPSIFSFNIKELYIFKGYTSFTVIIKYWLYPQCRLHPCSLFYLFISSFVFLGQHPRHMGIPRLGVELELLLLAYTTATATCDLSRIFDLHHNSWQRWILNLLSEVRNTNLHPRGYQWSLLTTEPRRATPFGAYFIPNSLHLPLLPSPLLTTSSFWISGRCNLITRLLKKEKGRQEGQSQSRRCAKGSRGLSGTERGQGMQSASRSWKRHGDRFSLRTSRRKTAPATP